MTVIRLVLAIQTSDPKPTRIRIQGDIGTSAVLSAVSRVGAAPAPVPWNGGAWTIDLDADDHLLRLEDEQWTAGRLTIEPLLDVGQAAPVFVSDSVPGTPPGSTLTAWLAPATYCDPPSTSLVGDPKDPMPPPPPPPPVVTLASPSATWLTAALADARSQVQTQLVARFGKAMPDTAIAAAAARSADLEDAVTIHPGP